MTLPYGKTAKYTNFDRDLLRRINSDLDKDKSKRLVKLIKVEIPEWILGFFIEVLNNHPQVRTLSFEHNTRIKADDLVFQRIVSETKHIVTLWFNAQPIPARAAFAMSLALLGPGSNITSIYLFNPELNSGAIKEIGIALGRSTKITTFMIEDNSSSKSRDWTPIIDAFKNNKDSLEHFEITKTHLTNAMMQTVFSVLPSKRNLTTLVLENNHMYNVHNMRPVNDITFYPFNEALTTLRFYNILSTESCASLADAMRVNTTMQRLCLESSPQRPEGLTHIVEAIHHHPTLHEVIATSYPQPPISTLIGLLRHNRVLRIARVSVSIEQTPEDLEELRLLIQDHPSIVTLNLNRTEGWIELYETYQRTCRRNRANHERKTTSLFDVMRRRDCIQAFFHLLN